VKTTEVLDLQADLITRLDNWGVRYAWTGQLMAEALDRANPPSRAWAENHATTQLKALGYGLPHARAFHVSQDMSTLLTYAAAQLSEEDKFDSSLAPSKFGFARFEGGLPFYDMRGQKLIISYMYWAPVQFAFTNAEPGVIRPDRGTIVFLFNDEYEEPDEIAAKALEQFGEKNIGELRTLLGRWGLIGVNMVWDDLSVGPAAWEPEPHKIAEVVADGDVPQAFTNCARYLHAFWLMTSQTITTVETQRPPRAEAKRAKRNGIDPEVSVVYLRHASSRKGDGESKVEWTRRWVVDAHWRWQKVGPNHPKARELEPGKWRARIYIMPFVKGPEDKPLIPKKHVYAVHR
jgi:hypothetical protein